MRISVIVTFPFFLIICFYNITMGTALTPVLDSQSENNTGEDKRLVKEEITTEEKESKPISVELEATLGENADAHQSTENQPAQRNENQSPENRSNTMGTATDSLHEVSENEESESADTEDTDEYSDTETITPLAEDPIQPYNRKVFTFNDKLYYSVFKPICTGYNKVMPEPARLSVRKFFLNIKTPVRLFNCLFQGKFKGAGTETLRLLINTTIGVGGFFDPAKSKFHLERQDEDFGQTLAKYKIGNGYYIEWPLIGPSTVRDTFGYVGDIVLNPLSLLSFFIAPGISFATNSYDTINDTAIDRGKTYETITQDAIDPYIALQDAYLQNRVKKIKE